MAGLYIHVPFCAKRCLYCDFYSNTDMSYKVPYLEALLEELALRRPYLEGKPVETIYFGGGTPSQLSSKDFERIFEAIYRHYAVSPDAEITVEANPDDVDDAFARMLRRLPFNRVSMGVQSFDAEDLRFLNRRHSREQAIRAVGLCRDAYIYNVSIDLIYGLPGQTEAKWEANVREALRLDIPHLSAYHLIYEEGTALYKLWEAGKVEAVDEETSVSLFSLLINRMREAGYLHYEISNFARKGCRSRHNSSYWKGIPYLGCGPSAHSYDGRNRQWNTPNLELYLREVGRCASPEDFMEAAWIEKEQLSTAERYNDLVVTALRTCEGIDLSSLRHSFGDSFAAYCLRNAAPHLQKGSLEILPVSSAFPEGRLRLTRKGLFLSDGIMSDLLWVEETD